MRRALILKWEQNQRVRQELEETGEKNIAEANLFNKIWSIGLGKLDPRVENVRNWRGMNKLGRLWMEIRAHVRK